MKKKLILGLSAILVALVVAPMFAAFEAHVINVTATIENALFVHPVGPFEFGTVFPQEEFSGFGFDVSTSKSFSASTQTRVLNIDYVIKQKPKPKPEYISQVGEDEARKWCHENKPTPLPNDPNDPYYDKCYPVMCSYVSKNPQVQEPGDVGVPSFHDPETKWAIGTLHKKISVSDPKPNDTNDSWIIDFSVPCFYGECAQDWTHQGFELPAGLEGETFGCDLWVEVTKIY